METKLYTSCSHCTIYRVSLWYKDAERLRCALGPESECGFYMWKLELSWSPHPTPAPRVLLRGCGMNT